MNASEKSYIELLCEKCNELYEVWVTYKTLYDDNLSPHHNIDKLEYVFFRLRYILHEYFILSVCKLHDPIKSGNNNNVTLEYLRSVDWKDEKEEIIHLLDELKSFAIKLKPARNRIIAHSDLQSCAENCSLGSFSENDDITYFAQLEKLVHKVSKRSTGEMYVFNDLAKVDAKKLLDALGPPEEVISKFQKYRLTLLDELEKLHMITMIICDLEIPKSHLLQQMAPNFTAYSRFSLGQTAIMMTHKIFKEKGNKKELTASNFMAFVDHNFETLFNSSLSKKKHLEHINKVEMLCNKFPNMAVIRDKYTAHLDKNFSKKKKPCETLKEIDEAVREFHSIINDYSLAFDNIEYSTNWEYLSDIDFLVDKLRWKNQQSL